MMLLLRRSVFFVLFVCAAFLAAPRASCAADVPSVWSGVVFATNEDQPKEAPPELKRFKSQLAGIFGYNQFELIGQHTEKMDDPKECWLIPSNDFFLKVKSKTDAAKGKGYALMMELFHDKRRLAEFETRLGPQSPLFIRGPLYAGGQLIIVLLVK